MKEVLVGNRAGDFYRNNALVPSKACSCKSMHLIRNLCIEKISVLRKTLLAREDSIEDGWQYFYSLNIIIYLHNIWVKSEIENVNQWS